MNNTQPDPIDVALRTLLDQPTHAARILTTLARLLEVDAHEEMTGLVRERLADVAADTTLHTLPDTVAHESRTRAYAAMPPLALDTTRGQYALLVRTAARSLG